MTAPRRDRAPRDDRGAGVTGVRVAMGLLAVSAAAVGLPATIAPHAFFASWPLGREWVSALPAYNQHLVGDVGGFYLAFAVLLVLV